MVVDFYSISSYFQWPAGDGKELVSYHLLKKSKTWNRLKAEPGISHFPLKF